MSIRGQKKVWLLVTAIILVGGVGLLAYLAGALDYIPRVHALAKSPDGALTVMVYRQRLWPRPIFPRIGAIAKVYDHDGRLVYEKTIYEDDDWDDAVGNAYTQISFVADEIRIGPNPYRPDSPFIIRRSDLWNSLN